ncbi:MAG: endonuclease/exonuclease/phosphatase family protein, partial [Candidatus Nomurabacteria bacterium]|nr:endonuclease/exonuclease/phosphatase family protein [Candidatus Nomurabacteria bacterium]
MKLISINIEANKHTKTVTEFLKEEKADVVCMQELLEEEFEFYKKELAFEGVFQPFDYCCHHVSSIKTYDVILELNKKRHGVAIFTKDIINSGFIFYEGQKENILKSYDEYTSDEKFQKNKTLIWVETKDTNGTLFKFVTTQLPVTHKGEVTPYQIEIINSMLSNLKNLGELVLCGDMNAPRGHQSFTIINENYKDNIPLEYKTSIDQNLHRVKGIQFMVDGLFTTPIYKA